MIYFRGLNLCSAGGGSRSGSSGYDSDKSDALENVTKTIGSLLKGYDIRLRPNFGGKHNTINR